MALFNLFKKKPVTEEVAVTARLNARVQPLDRGEYFEDPLNEALEQAGLGEVVGGGTQMADEPAGIAFCELEISIMEASDTTLKLITSTLEGLGAPKGSKLIIHDEEREVEFGQWEGLAIYLNGTDLPEAVYANSDVNEFISECDRLLKDLGEFRGHWQGSKETALYFYGTDYAAMEVAIRPAIAKEPLCELSRLEQIA